MLSITQIKSEYPGVDCYYDDLNDYTVYVAEAQFYSLERIIMDKSIDTTFMCDGQDYRITDLAMDKITNIFSNDLPYIARLLYHNKEILKALIPSDVPNTIKNPVECLLKHDGSKCLHTCCSSVKNTAIIYSCDVSEFVNIPICKSARSMIREPII
jgi:hypothetical protein